MRKLIIVFIFTCVWSASHAQKHQFEIKELTGTVVKILPGWRFAYSTIEIKTGDESWPYLFYPNNATLMFASFKPGDPIEFRAQIDVTARKDVAKVREMIMIYLRDRDRITHIRINQKWVEIHDDISPIMPNGKWAEVTGDKRATKSFDKWKIILDKKIESDWFEGNFRVAVRFDDGTVAFNLLNSKYHYPLKDTKPGDVISCMGFEQDPVASYVYPIKNISRVFTYQHLSKTTGTIKAFLAKQNYAFIGFTLTTPEGPKRFSFPSDRAMELKRIADSGDVVAVYASDFYNPDKSELAPVHGLIHGTDTLLFQHIYLGSADVPHQHTPVTFDGKITRINRNERGTMISMIIGDTWFIEVSGLLGRQLQDQLTKGRALRIEGRERIKFAGEIYEKSYRIVVPQKLVIEGKEFLTNF